MDVSGTLRNKLAALLGGGGRSESLFAARQEYNRYASEANAAGSPAMGFEEWMQARRGRPNALLNPQGPQQGPADPGGILSRPRY